MGASVDHANQIMYVTANNIPWIAEVVKDSYKNYNYNISMAFATNSKKL
jgi:hypothetical protein